jgi:hypothetical protein
MKSDFSDGVPFNCQTANLLCSIDLQDSLFFRNVGWIQRTPLKNPDEIDVDEL